ncbi:MAG: tyrosine/phenylalanine carboxypeptidase domain-containing protein, partial [Pirellulales bacterium]
MSAKKRQSARRSISDAFVDEVGQRLSENRRVRRTLPEGGRLHVDRPLPFLCIYRRPGDGDDPGTQRLVTGEAAFLIASGNPHLRRSVARLVRRIARSMGERFGAMLLIEVYAAGELTHFVPPGGRGRRPPGPGGVPRQWKPGFALATKGPQPSGSTINALLQSLRGIRVHRQTSEVELRRHTYGRPPGLPPLISAVEAKRMGCRLLGLEVRPIWRDAESGDFYPATLRTLRRRLSRALKEAFFAFVRAHTNVRPEHFYALGRQTMVQAVWEVDRRLADVADSFDFLLQVTPVNAEAAWREFHRSRFRGPLRLAYRPLPADPGVLKRRLFDVPIGRIEDPTLAHLFYQVQDELDRKITLLRDIGTPRFLLGSRALFGGVPSSLLTFARQLLDAIPPHARDGDRRPLDAEQFAEAAERRIGDYRRAYAGFAARATVRDDMYSGLLVSRGELLIGRRTRIPAARGDPLLQHEV